MTSKFTTMSLKPLSPHQGEHGFSNEHFGNSAAFAKRLALLACASVLAVPTLLIAAGGTLDPAFGNNGIVSTPNTSAIAAALQSDGKLVIAGSIATTQNPQQGGLLRYDTIGNLDPNFGTGGEVAIAVGSSNAAAAFAVAIQPDGKILAAAPANLDLEVFRFNTNGRPDTTCGNNGAVAIEASGIFLGPASGGIALQSDGKILVASGRVLARLLPNGQLDATFGSHGVVATIGGGSIALLPNGEILLSGSSLYTSNGSLDTAVGVEGQTAAFPFNAQGGVVVTTNPTTHVTKFVTASSIITSPNLAFGKTVSGFLLVRYDSNGSIDNSFGNHGGVATPFPGNVLAQAFTVGLQSNGDVVAAGQTAPTDVDAAPGPSDFALARFTANGKLDVTFGNGGLVSTPFGNSEAFVSTVLIQTDGKIIAVGNSDSGTTIARYFGD